MHLRLQLNLNYGNKINIIQKQIKTLFEKKTFKRVIVEMYC